MYSINTDISQVLIDCSTFLSSLHQHNESTRMSFTRTYKCRYSSQTPKKNERKRKDYLKGICFLEYDGHFLRVLGIYLLLFLKSRRSLSQFFFCSFALKESAIIKSQHTTTNVILRLWNLFLNNFTRQLRIKKIHSERVQVQRSKFTSETRFWNFMFKRKHE